jgi:putative two-component system response regulator
MKKKILAVDDDVTALDAMRQNLERKGYAVVTANSGEDALEYVASNEAPDLILLDVQMPGINGYETCRRLRAASKTEKVPIVFLTGRSELDDLKQGKEAGSDLYLVKPVLGNKLLSFVGMFLSDTPLSRRSS